MNIRRNKQPTKYQDLLKALVSSGQSFFSFDDIRRITEKANLSLKDTRSAVSTLVLRGLIHSVKRDLYMLDWIVSGHPISEFEIATHLAQPSAISHFSAFYIHELTDQIPNTIFVSVPTGTSLPRVGKGKLFTYKGVRYRFIAVRKEHFFGLEYIQRSDARIQVIDLERTLLDGLIRPKYCGGFSEVLHAFSISDFDIKKIIDYALRLDASVAKRLGWVLEKFNYNGAEIDRLFALPFKGYAKLNPSGEKKGPYNKRWHIQENI